VRHAKGWRTISSPFLGEGCARCLQFLLLLHVDRRIGEVEFLYGFNNGCCDNKPSKPLVVRWHHVPRCAFRCGGPNSFLIRMHVVAPEPALVHVGG
jgi:hypothetical protein